MLSFSWLTPDKCWFWQETQFKRVPLVELAKGWRLSPFVVTSLKENPWAQWGLGTVRWAEMLSWGTSQSLTPSRNIQVERWAHIMLMASPFCSTMICLRVLLPWHFYMWRILKTTLQYSTITSFFCKSSKLDSGGSGKMTVVLKYSLRPHGES